MIYVLGPKDSKEMWRVKKELESKNKSECLINTTSSSKNWSIGLSPFLIGPVKLYNNYISQNMENAWQYSKVYKNFVDENNNPTQEYFQWAENGWAQKRANRYPMGKNTKPLYSFWDNKKLSYIEAKKEIYIPLYKKAVIQTEAFTILKEIYENNDNIWLWDFDGYDYIKENIKLNDVINQENKKMGHAFILALILENLI